MKPFARRSIEFLFVFPCLCLCAKGAVAQNLALFPEIGADIEIYGVALSTGLALFSAFLALAYIAERRTWRVREAQLTAELEETRALHDRAKTFLTSEQQLFVAWEGTASEPDIEGSLLSVANALAPRRLLAFGTWLVAADAQELEGKVDALRRRGESFRLAVNGLSGRCYDVEGRAVGGRAILRIREISGDRVELMHLRQRFERKNTELAELHSLLDVLPAPFWQRDADGRIIFVNSAYVHAVEAKDAADALSRQLELLDENERIESRRAREQGRPWSDRVTAVVAGARRALDIIQTPSLGAAAIAFDRQEIESMRADYEQQMQSHRRTLDQLPSAVAIFNGAQQLIYRNAAYEKLWRLASAFLDGRPSDGEILDQLRLEQRLPLEGDFRAWKARLLEVYRSQDEHTHVWHMPDGRTTICVKVMPNPKGGVTYLYEDISENYDLKSRFNALHRMQHETLETLHEGVVVFGADGRLNLSNPAFASLWRLDAAMLAERPHIESIAAHCKRLAPDDSIWMHLRRVVTGLGDMRTGFSQRINREDGVVLDLTAQPLPEGATLLSFVDVTSDANVERALVDRNKALLAAEKLRNDFIHHVSYELRSPLTNINGFVHLLSDEATGALNAKQQEYVGYVRKSSAALLAIIDDILDLATIDEKAMELELEDVDARGAMESAIEGLQDRIIENKVELQVSAAPDIGTFRGDKKRVRQILFNLLSNAIGFSRAGQKVCVSATRDADKMIFTVVDQGRGIPPEVLERVFDRFESNTTGSSHRGLGLGLSIVRAFMELHGGKIDIQSTAGQGTKVTCVFHAAAATVSAATAATESVEPRRAEIEALGLVRATAAGLAAELERTGVRLRLLEPKELGVLLGDEQQLLTALTDLLLDAIDSTRTSEAVTFAGMLRQNEVVFKVADRGGGVDKRRDEARKFVEANGGKMLVESVPGERSTITCIFPAPKRATGA